MSWWKQSLFTVEQHGLKQSRSCPASPCTVSSVHWACYCLFPGLLSLISLSTGPCRIEFVTPTLNQAKWLPPWGVWWGEDEESCQHVTGEPISGLFNVLFCYKRMPVVSVVSMLWFKPPTEYRADSKGCWAQSTRAQVPGLDSQFSSCETLGNLLNLPEPQFLPQSSGKMTSNI